MSSTDYGASDYFTDDENFNLILDQLPRPARKAILTVRAKPIEIRTARFRLREMRPEDFEVLAAAHRDAEHRRFVLPHQHGDNYVRTKIAAAMLASRSRKRRLYDLAIEQLHDGALVGTSGFSLRGFWRQRAFLGWEIPRNYSGRNAATETGRALLSFISESLDIHEVQADCDSRNTRCIGALLKLGMQPLALSSRVLRSMGRRYRVDLPFARFVLR